MQVKGTRLPNGSRRANYLAETPMDDKSFRKHLAALVHGHHHPEEHDWSTDGRAVKSNRTAKPAKKAARTAARRKK